MGVLERGWRAVAHGRLCNDGGAGWAERGAVPHEVFCDDGGGYGVGDDLIFLGFELGCLDVGEGRGGRCSDGDCSLELVHGSGC